MSNRSNVIVVRTLSIVTIGILFWAWHFLMAVVASADSRTAPVIHVVSTPRGEINTRIGRREGDRTRERRGTAPDNDVSVGTLHQKALRTMIHDHSLTVLPMIIGALIVCLVAPIRVKDKPTDSSAAEIFDRKAA